MQKPHWSAWWRRNDSWSALRGPFPARDSTVSTRAAGLHRKDAAAPDGGAVEEHRAGAADPVLAAHVRPRQPEAVAEKVGEQEPRLDGLPDTPAVDRELDLGHEALSIARVTSVAVSAFR